MVMPVANTQATRLLASDGHKLVAFKWDYQNTTIDSSDSSQATIIASVDTENSKTGNRWNDGKADIFGRLWGGNGIHCSADRLN